MDFKPQELQLLVARCTRDLGSPDRWISPGGYPESLALCVVDAIFSLNGGYTGVLNVVNHYRRIRATQRGNADIDGPIELLGTFEYIGGDDAWADLVENHWRTLTTGGILKSSAVRQAAHVLARHGAWSVTDIHEAALAGRLDEIEVDWKKVNGQGQGTTWGYVLILARPQRKFGATDELVERYAEAVVGVKPDRMIKRYVAKAIGVEERDVTNTMAGLLVKAAAKSMHCDAFGLDHVIWRYQSGRPHLKANQSSTN